MSLVRRPAATPNPAEPPGRRSSSSEIDAFLGAARALSPSGGSTRLVFALDATASRAPTWAVAREVQAGLFEAVSGIGGLSVQLAYFRGQAECRASGWVTEPARLRDLMLGIGVQGGATQIGRILAHAANEARRSPVRALVFVGDAVEEPLDPLLGAAGELALLGVRTFMLQEGRDPRVAQAFREIAHLTGGASLAFDLRAAAMLGDLLRAIAAFAAGGLPALRDLGTRQEGARRLLAAMPT